MLNKRFCFNKKLKIFLYFLLGVFTFFCLIFLSLPSIVSTSWGTKWIVTHINRHIPGNISINKLDLNWFDDQIIEQFEWQDPRHSVHFQKLECKAPLWKIFFIEYPYESLAIHSLNLSLIEEKTLSQIFLNEIHLEVDFPSKENHFSAKIFGKTLFKDKSGEFELLTTIQDLYIPSIVSGYFSNNKPFKFLKNPDIHLNGEISHFPVEVLDRVVGFYQPSLNGIFLTTLGESLDLSLTQTGNNEKSQVLLKLSSPFFNGECQAEFQKKVDSLEEPGLVTLTETPEHFQCNALIKLVHDKQTGELSFTAKQISFNLETLPWYEFELKGNNIPSKMIDQWASNTQKQIATYALGDSFDFHLEARANSQNALGSLALSSSQIYLTNLQFHLNSDLNHFSPHQRIIQLETKLQIDPFSTAFARFSKAQELFLLFGPSIQSKIELSLDAQNRPHFLDVSLQGDQFHADAAFLFDDKISLHNNQPIKIDWTLTPERFSILRKIVKGKNKLNDLILSEASTLLITIPEFQLPINKTAHSVFFDIKHLACAINLDLKNIYLTDQQIQQKVLLENLTLNLATHDLSEALKVNISTSGHHTEQTSLNLSSLINQPLKKDNSLNFEGMTLNIKGLIKRAPIFLFCNFICLNDQMLNEVDAIFGRQLSAEINMGVRNFTGPVYLKISGEKSYLTLDGTLNEGVLTLKQPLICSIQVTPKIHKSFLTNIVPFLGSAIHSEKPVHLTFDPKGFSLPLRNWDIKKISIGRGMIDLGKITFQTNDQLKEILELLHYTNRKEIETIWFTPLYLQINQGVIQCERTDMLIAGLFPIAMWGNVQLPQTRIHLTIGLTGTTLSRAFGVHGLPNDAMLQLPLRGTGSNIVLDTKQAKQKVSMLIAKNKNTAHGLLIGGILDILGAEEEKPPEPTTKPLPWKTEDQEETFDLSTPITLPLKAIEKGAKEVLKLFKHE